MASNGDITAEDENSRRVQVRFITKLQSPLKVSLSSIAIPSNLTRRGLSALVNSIIQAGDSDWEPIPFDFLIHNELIRMSLEEFLIAKEISAEKTLEIEYIQAVVPRKEEGPLPHPDWMSAVSGAYPGFILSGCCDSSGRIWNSDGMCTHILEGHSNAITSVSIINPKVSGSGAKIRLATASKDRTLRLWEVDINEPVVPDTKVRAFKILRGHKSAVQSVAARPSGDMVCSGSWDCTINLWGTNESDAEDESIKKRKLNNNAEKSQTEGEVISELVGHKECVSSVCWPQHETIYSASWDHYVRRWDVETGTDSYNVACGKALNCLDVGGEGSALIAAGGSDPVLRIWDPRKPGTSAPIFQFSSHASWITSCKWHDKSWFHLLSSSYDGKIMLWDLRTAWPVSVLESHNDKVLCADWWKDDSVISGGADSKLCISSGISVL
ncbi:hypothetical protein GIB67_016871 [Kingdonia uniflora]|uniref:Ribosome biogenesis protein WDR12 homolog n=1 Tax=Kingdonia uniflora TaxID=39325 RepID=A0A7J7M365_9MAGN|nr:hypothetical protein GIB67_016871 [Kingdonia uniflora]